MPNADLWSQDADAASNAANLNTKAEISHDGGVAVDATTSDPIDGLLIPEPNDDPLKRRTVNADHGLKKIIRVIGERLNPPLTAAERAALDDQQRIKLLNQVLTQEAKDIEIRLKHALDNLGYSFVTKASDGSISRVKFVEFRPIVSTEDAHWYHVDFDRLPRGVNSSDLVKQDLLNHLGKSVQHKVNVRATDEAGIWYVVERASGMMGLPKHVNFSDMWDRFPPSANSLTIPLGMTQNRKAVFQDLDDLVHVLVAGETGGGKSNSQAIFINSLAMRNTPDSLQMLLLDMKAGMEFQFYENIPNLIEVPGVTKTGIIEDPDQVYPAFAWLLDTEAKRRMALIRGANHRSIKDYNTRRKNPLPRLLVVCDEWGIARLAKNGKRAEQELAKAVQLLRAAGIHILIGTQTPTKEVLGLLVRSNLPTKLVHNCNEISASVLVVGDASAMGLPPGRAIFYRSGTKMPVQVPYLSETAIKNIVADIKSGKHQPDARKSHDVTIDEMLAYALHNMAGSLKYQDVHKAFGHRGITRDEVADALKAVDGKEVTVEDKLYRVEPGAGSRPRRLVVTENPTETEKTENA